MMGAETKLIPASSQTVGPYFKIGLEYMIDRVPGANGNREATVELRGRVLDRDGSPVPDAMLEFWSPANGAQDVSVSSQKATVPEGFRRAVTDLEGNYSIVMNRPVVVRPEDHTVQAPHMLVLVFARGLLRHLISRVYFEGEHGNETDPVLLTVPAERRHTLIGRLGEENSFHWDVILQGADETVFFAW
jgi:protocatechuate 3,4-dioxygenase, alpha subunit